MPGFARGGCIPARGGCIEAWSPRCAIKLTRPSFASIGVLSVTCRVTWSYAGGDLHQEDDMSANHRPSDGSNLGAEIQTYMRAHDIDTHADMGALLGIDRTLVSKYVSGAAGATT